MTPDVFDQDHFRNVLGHFCTGITVVTTIRHGMPVGFTCQAFTALSLDPPMVLFCPTKRSASWHAIQESGHFCVNVLGEKQRNISAQFGSRAPDKFAGVSWHASVLGSPIIDDALAIIDCTLQDVHEGGDHFVVYGSVQELSRADEDVRSPLLFYRGEYAGIERTTTGPELRDSQTLIAANAADGWV